ncbi:transcriptional repressor [Candidatus Peregrinibacteria bacterium CG22_combo_CG10-13_8_21_14_all_44_10]|nr:MAG: hypothetical protein AUK45_05155 [Candidatus Peregrinibacteria bacterium CG2_30_44_17]PIP66197.1 MAG: transcriptional repressor [Candidatus Peregrinibacteria bacterium CG22_combo_CG10-13_8_21_14_all_44_10]PIS04445.1 MAG: transcriptional repressor [Candidatus Peregrinibacteria bacterium CG10_big_fil_rev_8_21_14_0_10_44_7]PIX80352.1 MAG: transcriptional repressor [Candidatus Peregrinibacteria bacterium CG_4_10_14_3_um_filter_44_21]PJB89084.1 MAG: transcriptional repressor [Candidatus Pere
MLKEQLQGTKYRLTNQRQILLEEIQKVHTHPTAEEVYEIVRKRIPNVSFATVYRNLDFLSQNGFIIKLHTKDKKTRYDGYSDPHLHLCCKKCGYVVDIFDCKCKLSASEDLEETGFSPDLSCLEIPGLCKKCNSKN